LVQLFTPSGFKFFIPAKDVIQAFAAGIRLEPGIAYGEPSELTPDGNIGGEFVARTQSILHLRIFYSHI
jgi:hypothetical protein